MPNDMQPPVGTEREHSHATLFIWLGLLVVALLAISLFALFFTTENRQSPPSVTSETIRLGEAARPAFTEAVKEKVRASGGFHVLVSYTDSGFEPQSARIKAGQTVRFTNNSSQPFELETGGTRVTIAVQDFYEHTYDTAGGWAYSGGGVAGNVLVE